MKILEIRDIQRDEAFIYYRRVFSGVAVIEIPLKNVEASLSFIIEMLPTGKKEVHLDIFDSINYPFLPLKKALVEFILNLDNEGLLP